MNDYPLAANTEISKLKKEIERLKIQIPLAVEFGYKECEKGNNIQMAFINYNKLTKKP